MNIRLDIEYDGSLYAGWQIQRNEKSVQSVIEGALETIVKSKIKIIGAGRTDAGVHASGQVANFKTDALPVSQEELKRSLNGLLREGVTIRNVALAPDDFHARYSAKSRTYVYRISKGKRSIDRHKYYCVHCPLDIERMKIAAAKLLGKHDFKNISIATGEKSTMCNVASVDIADQADEIRLTITADRFLHKMVRMLVGLLVEIGRGKVSMGYLEDVLSGKKIKRKQGFAAPAHGLCLVKVTY